MQRSDGNGGGDATEGSGSFSVDRRSYLKLAGVAAGSVPMLSGAASAAFTRRGIRFERSVDMVRDAGCDPSGNEPCDQQIRDAADSFTLLRFPPGEYLITEKNVILDETNVGFLGEGDVRFTVPKNYNEKMLIVDRGTGVLFENIDVDLRAAGATPGLLFGADDDLEVHDVEYIGQGIHPDSDPRGQGNGNPAVTYAFYPIIRSSDGTGTVSNVVAKNAGLMGAYNGGNGRVGVWIGLSHKGTVTLESCRFEGFPNNGLYCSRTGGAVQVEGGVFRNNDITQVRLSNTDSHVKDAVISADFDNSDSPNPGDTLNSRGVRFEAGRYGYGGAHVENCDIGIISTPNSSGGVVVGSDGADHSVLNTRITVEEDSIRGFYAKAPTGYGSRDPPPKPHDAELRDVSVTGGANNTSAIRIDQRDDSVVSGCCVDQPGADRDGVVVSDSNGGVVTDSTIDVVGRTVVEDNSRVSTSGISTSGSCPVANFGAGDSLPRKLTFEGGSGRFDYRFTVGGDLGKSTARGATIDSNDSVSGSSASGQGGSGGVDSYGFSGALLTLDVSGDAAVYLDGERIDPDEYPNNVLTIEGDGSRADYTLATSDTLAYTRANDATIDADSDRWESTATGRVSSGDTDSYKFSGALVVFDIDGDATAYLNGERIDPDDYLDNVLTIEGSGSVDEYTLASSGTLKSTGANGASIDPNDEQWGSTVTGQVGGGGRDSYKFSGALVALDVSGDTTAYLNGERIDPDEYFDNVLTIEGGGSVAEYTLASSGMLNSTGANGASIDSNDEQWGSTATGQVGRGGRDSYKFSGALVVLDLERGATAYLNGERIDPDDYLDNVVTIEGGGSGAEYTLASSGTLKSTGANDASINSSDEQWESTATGRVGDGGRDSYKFSGVLVVLGVSGDATVYLNGERIDPDEYLDNVLTIVGTGSMAEYSLSTSGTLKRTGANGATIDSTDEMRGSTATGQVGYGGRDSYKFSGELTDSSLSGPATTYLNGDEIKL
ncbi:hypothetical protein [Halococcus sediminicola]|uniref:hypothetical protein n=1 Tax=Halococcus sediminicola TaxID=1264579 RepID=UPI001F43B605|nr:hypothetical protein [Halococcus sediminicola]